MNRSVLLCVSSLCVLCASVVRSSAEPLPGTQPLTETGDLARRVVDGIHAYLDRELAASAEGRKKFWKVDRSSTATAANAKAVEPNRERLRTILGVVDRRSSPRLEYVGGPDEPAVVAQTDAYTVTAVRWAVFPGVDGEGLLLEPKGKAAACVVAVPDADQTPEQVVGLATGLPAEKHFARRLAENGCRVIVPVLLDRSDTFSGSPWLNRWTNQSHREFVHRMAYEMGRTLTGYEVQKVLAAVDWFCREKDHPPVAVVGYGEGGRTAHLSGALDPRVRNTVVSGSFGPPEAVWDQPIDRNVWGYLREFGDAELTALFANRSLTVEHAEWPKVTGPPAPRPGRGGAAPGRLVTPLPEAVQTEWARGIEFYFPFRSSRDFRSGDGLRSGQDESIKSIRAPDVIVTKPPDLRPNGAPPKDLRTSFDPASRQKRQFDQLVGFTQKLWRDSDAVRKAYWKKADPSSPETWGKTTEDYRRYFHEEVIGKLPDPTIPPNPRTRQVYDEPTWTGYEVMLDVYPDVFACGILLMPKDLKPGEKRPVVVCQHGLEGRPTDTINAEKRPVYNQFARRLAERGYVVYAPQNPYIFENHFRQIQRKANPLKLSLFSFIIAQHRRTLDWLETLPNVDPKRIGFYGLSYGGKTAMRVPAVEKRYCLSICSADFNEWVGKCVSVDLDRSYMWTDEYDMYEFDLGHTFDYAEMASLIAPRPFMVERGHDDGVGTDEMVAYEYAKVRYLYANKLKLPDRTAIEFSPGGHQIFLKGTLAFLEQHLGKPRP